MDGSGGDGLKNKRKRLALLSLPAIALCVVLGFLLVRPFAGRPYSREAEELVAAFSEEPTAWWEWYSSLPENSETVIDRADVRQLLDKISGSRPEIRETYRDDALFQLPGWSIPKNEKEIEQRISEFPPEVIGLVKEKTSYPGKWWQCFFLKSPEEQEGLLLWMAKYAALSEDERGKISVNPFALPFDPKMNG